MFGIITAVAMSLTNIGRLLEDELLVSFPLPSIQTQSPTTLAERTIGHPDPGVLSLWIILKAASDYINN